MAACLRSAASSSARLEFLDVRRFFLHVHADVHAHACACAHVRARVRLCVCLRGASSSEIGGGSSPPPPCPVTHQLCALHCVALARCGAMRCGAARRGAVRCGAVRRMRGIGGVPWHRCRECVHARVPSRCVPKCVPRISGVNLVRAVHARACMHTHESAVPHA